MNTGQKIESLTQNIKNLLGSDKSVLGPDRLRINVVPSKKDIKKYRIEAELQKYCSSILIRDASDKAKLNGFTTSIQPVAISNKGIEKLRGLKPITDGHPIAYLELAKDTLYEESTPTPDTFFPEGDKMVLELALCFL